MRILIADDEPLVRYSLISILKDVLAEPPTIIEAENGRELVEKTRDSRPHIGFVDIRMPRCDGLDGITRASEYAPNTLWVILSGHADFSYAQRALKLGVEEFLLKPPDPAELTALMDRLVLKARERQRRGNHELEAKVSGILGETSSVHYDEFFSKPRFWQAGLVYWDSLLADHVIAKCRRDFAGQIMNILDGQSDYSGCVVSMKDGALLIVLSMPAGGTPMDKVIESWHRRFHSLQKRVMEDQHDQIGETWLLTRVTQDSEELFEEIETLSSDAALRYIRRPHTVMEYAEFLRGTDVTAYLSIATILDHLRQAKEMGREDDFHGHSHALLDTLGTSRYEAIAHADPSWYARYVLPLNARNFDTLYDLAKDLHDEGHLMFADVVDGDDSTSTLVNKALLVMNRRYRETIGVAQVADELGVNPNYLSTIIKRESGKTFTRQLTELRLEKACEILARPGSNIGEVARSLGYQSSRHFTRLFKERFGLTPSEWITRQRN